MHFKFDANQEYQLAAIEAVADLFDGQVVAGSDFQLRAGSDLTAVANRLDLDEASILANLRLVQARHRIAQGGVRNDLQEIRAPPRTRGARARAVPADLPGQRDRAVVLDLALGAAARHRQAEQADEHHRE